MTEGQKGKPGYYRPANLCKDLVGNRLVNYVLTNNNTLINPKILLKIPSIPGPTHNGGFVTIGPDNYIYFHSLGYESVSI